MNAQRNTTIQVIDLRMRRYADVWALQRRLLEQTVATKVANRKLPAAEQQPTPNYLLLVEHPPVYTLGKSGKLDHLLLDEASLHARGIDYFPIERGGDITYHGPGQLVGYPVFDLENFFTDIGRYLRLLEEALILCLAPYGLQAGRITGLTGVWLGMGTPLKRKIAAMGIKCSRWVTMHGFALNITTDLDYFSHIIPCGIADEDKTVTSLLAETGQRVPLDEIKPVVAEHIAQLFGGQLVPASEDVLLQHAG